MAVGARRTQQVLRHFGDGRRQAWIVRAALNQGSLLYERLIFPVQIAAGFDRDRTPAAQDRMMGGEAADLSSGVRIQPERP